MLVALTGYGTPEARERSRQAGFHHHLIKPVNTEALQAIMRADAEGSGGGPHVASSPSDAGSSMPADVSSAAAAGAVVAGAVVAGAASGGGAAGASALGARP